MRVARPVISLLLVCACFTATLLAQTTTPTPQPITVLQNALKALVGSTAVNDVTLTGTAERIAGSDDETGTVTYRAVATCNRLDLNLSQGTRSEVRGIGTYGPGGNWIGPDGVVHEISNHNLLTDAGWFPVFTLGNLISSANSVLTYVGTETKDGVSVIHITASQQLPNTTASIGTLWQHLTQLDIYLDASTLLPAALDFNTHPDNNAGLDIRVEFRFSDYRSAGSASVPFHVQQFFNGSLFLDVQFQTASVNSGLSSSSTIFAIQ
jgi:hypothetical protein